MDHTDLSISYEMVVTYKDYEEWCKMYEFEPTQSGFEDYAKQTFLNKVFYDRPSLSVSYTCLDR